MNEGQHAEAGLEACDWITELGRRLERGYVLTIDYGHPAADLFDEHHMRGTLLAYHDHRVSEEYYASPGEQDLTAHANFTALESWGKRVGLETAGFTSQTAFLMALGRGNEFADLYDDGQTDADRTKARLQLKTLIHPEGMGERFQVLIQRKGVTACAIDGPGGNLTEKLVSLPNSREDSSPTRPEPSSRQSSVAGASCSAGGEARFFPANERATVGNSRPLKIPIKVAEI